jgi:hypothetical protein
MTNSFKKFRAQGFRDKATDYDNAVRTTNIRAKHKLEGLRAEKQNRENTSALLELRDIEDELHTLKELFNKQTSAIGLMIENYKKIELQGLTVNGLVFLKQAETKLQEYTHHAEKMIESVKSTRDDVSMLHVLLFPHAHIFSPSSINFSEWSNAKPKSTKYASLDCKQISPAPNPVQS